jgi:hypothetical protein
MILDLPEWHRGQTGSGPGTTGTMTTSDWETCFCTTNTTTTKILSVLTPFQIARFYNRATVRTKGCLRKVWSLQKNRATYSSSPPACSVRLFHIHDHVHERQLGPEIRTESTEEDDLSFVCHTVPDVDMVECTASEEDLR